MDCKYCGTPNPEDAVFCKECGKRLDGMKVCPSCGKMIPEDGKFCLYCGFRMEPAAPARQAESPVQPAQPAAWQQNGYAAPQPAPLPAQPQTQAYGAPSQPRPAADGWSAPAQPSGYGSPYYGAPMARPRMPAEKVKAILKAVADGLAAFGALLAFAFVFLIGGQLTGYIPDFGGSLEEAQSSYFPFFNGDWTIFSCFGDSYSAMADAAEAFGSTSFVKYAYDINAALSIVIAALTLAGAAACFIFAVVRYVRVLTHKTEKSMFGPAMATFVVFVAGVCLLNALMSQRFYMMQAVDGVALTDQFELVANGATVAGIVLGAVMLFGSLVTGLVREGRQLLSAQRMFGLIGGVVLAVLAFVALSMFSHGIQGGYSDSYAPENYHGEYEITLGISAILGSLFGYAETFYANGNNSGTFWNNFVDTFNAELVYIIIFVVAFIAMAALLAFAVPAYSQGGIKRVRTPFAIMGIVAGVFGILAGVMYILMGNEIASYLEKMLEIETANGIELDSGMAIGAIVVSVLLIIGSVIYMAVSKTLAARAYGGYMPPMGGMPYANGMADMNGAPAQPQGAPQNMGQNMGRPAQQNMGQAGYGDTNGTEG